MTKSEERRAKRALMRLGVLKTIYGRSVLDLAAYNNPRLWRGWDAWGTAEGVDIPRPEYCLRWFPGNGTKTVALVKQYVANMRAAPRTAAEGCMILLPLVLSERDGLRADVLRLTDDLTDAQLIMIRQDVARWSRRNRSG